MSDRAFGELFDQHAAALRRTAYALCGDWHRAEDLTQTAFVRCYAAWPRLREPAAAVAYLRRTLTRTFIDDNRRAWRREQPTADPPEPAARATTSDERLDLLAALARTPPRQRACLVLRYLDDLSVEETAAILGCSPGTVKSNTARGVATLRAVLLRAEADLQTIGGPPA